MKSLSCGPHVAAYVFLLVGFYVYCACICERAALQQSPRSRRGRPLRLECNEEG